MTSKQALVGFVLGMAGLTGAACDPSSSSSNNSGGPGCGAAPVAPCGGNVVGDWSVVQACPAASSPADAGACSGETNDLSGYHLTGTLSFKADGSYTETIQAAGTYVFYLPTECLTSVNITCDQENQLAQAALSQPSTPVKAVSCQMSGQGCACSIEYDPAVSTAANGTYAAAGTTITVTSSQGNAETNGYCVDGSSLYIISPTSGAVVLLSR